jgi:predicted secreted hydrolase
MSPRGARPGDPGRIPGEGHRSANLSSRQAAWLVFGGTLALSLVGMTYSLLSSRRRPAPSAPLSVGRLLGGGPEVDLGGFARATGPRRFTFPADHGPHPEFRSEWWYLTGQLQTGERRFGYQLTIFRQAMAPAVPPRASAWATRQVYMGHLALSDVAGGRFLAVERLAREGLNLAGAAADPLRVWIEDWTVAGGPRDLFPATLRARGERDGHTVALDLTVDAGKGPVLEGDAGLSAKGPEPGNASYYYSCTRLPTRGRVSVDGTSFSVAGTSWLDREWSTSALPPGVEGWDWLSLQLADGRDLMIYRLRRRDGGAAPESRATVIDEGGGTRVFGPHDFTLTPSRAWRSPATGTSYPVAMRVVIPAARIDLQVTPLLEDQELRLSVRYWEGAVETRGPLPGRGYLELTGY